jgi:hypothetical protein
MQPIGELTGKASDGAMFEYWSHYRKGKQCAVLSSDRAEKRKGG